MASVAMLTVVVTWANGNRTVLHTVPLNGQPVEPLMPQLKAFAYRNGLIDGISIDPSRDELLLVVRAKNLDSAHTSVIRWLEERNAETILSHSTNLIVQDLLNEKLAVGAPVEALLARIRPRVAEFGPYTEYLISDVADDATLSLVARAGVLKSAVVQHPDWYWIFFNDVPVTHSEKMIEARTVKRYIAENPESALELNAYLDGLLLSLQ